jgi:MFS family permease
MGGRYYLLLFAFLVSSLGNWIYRLTLPLLVLELTGSALHTATIYAIEYVPFLLMSLPGGVFADRFNRRRLLIAGDLAAGAVAMALAVLVMANVDALLILYLMAFLLACVEPIYHPAFYSWLPSLVERANVARANSWMQAGDNIVTMLGPVAAGAIVTLFSFEAAFVVDAATFVVSALAIMLIRRVPSRPEAAGPARRTGRGMRAEIAEAGHHVFKQNRVLLAGSLLFTGTNLAIWLVQANLVYYLTEYRHLEPNVVGAILAAQGVGAVLGATIAPRLLRKFPPGQVILGSTAGAGLITLAMVPVREPILIAAVWALVYVFSSMNVVSWFTFRQQIVPSHLLGRVIALTRMLAFSSIPAAALLGGALEASLQNMYVVIAIGGLLRLAVALAGTRTPLRSQSQPESQKETVRAEELDPRASEDGRARGHAARASAAGRRAFPGRRRRRRA